VKVTIPCLVVRSKLIIAKTRGVSEGTVKIHLGSIFQQPGVPNHAAAVAIYNAWQSGYLEVLKREADASPRPAPGDASPAAAARHRLAHLRAASGDRRAFVPNGSRTSTPLRRLNAVISKPPHNA
jgi:hypothetical protein